MTLNAEMSMPDPQQYPCNLYPINIVGDIVVFSIVVLKSDHSNMFFCSGNAQFTLVEKPQLEKYQF